MTGPIPGFDRYWLEMRAADLDTPMEVESVIKLLHLEPGQRLFDAGCGPGRIANALSKEGIDVVGVDISPELIEIAQTDPSGAAFYCGDYLDVDVGPDPFDAVLSWHTSWGYDTPAKNWEFFNRAYGLLKPGGRLLLQTWNPLGMPPQQTHWHRAVDGTLILEILDFSPEDLGIYLERAVVKAGAGLHQKAHCQTYTFIDLVQGLHEAGFEMVIPISVSVDHPWQVLVATKGSVS